MMGEGLTSWGKLISHDTGVIQDVCSFEDEGETLIHSLLLAEL